MVIKKYEKLFEELKPPEPRAALFDQIILIIKRKEKLQKRKRLLFGFLSLLIISFLVMPFSWTLLKREIRSSGILYFISAALSDFAIFFALWQDFSLAILESMPIMAIAIFTCNIVLSLFTLRLFLSKRRFFFESSI